MRICRALIVALMVIGPSSTALHAQGAKKDTCPGGFAACLKRCTNAGGQTTMCPRYCRQQKGC
jgi:hypothetical protein